MDEVKEKYFYTWTNHVGRTCFGITSDPANRTRNYEGHCGHPIEFDTLWKGPATHIEDLEDRVKTDFVDHLFATNSGKYEWINATIAPSQVQGYIEYEVDYTYNGMIKRVN